MKHTLQLMTFVACALGSLACAAAEPAKNPVLMSRDLIAGPDKEVIMLTVTSPPGGKSPAHRHDAQVFVYVLEGEMDMQAQGKPPVTLHPGDTFYEAPDDVHLVSANHSKTQPAKFLVVMIKDKNKPITTPVEGGAHAESGQERAQAAGQNLIGTRAPPLKLTTIDGKTIDLGSLYGKKAVYLKFWATWCVPCRQQMPHFEHAYETAGPDLQVVAVNVGFNDSVEEVRKVQKEAGLKMPIVFDGDASIGAAFNLRVTPQHIVIGRDGVIQYVGHLADARLDAALANAKSNVVPSTSVETLDGKPFALRDSSSRTLLLFMSPWCESYLQESRPALSANCRAGREQIAALSGNKGIRMLGIASGLWASTDDLREYRDKHQLAVPLTLDASGKLFREFQVTHVPTAIVVDRSGKITQRVEGSEISKLSEALH